MSHALACFRCSSLCARLHLQATEPVLHQSRKARSTTPSNSCCKPCTLVNARRTQARAPIAAVQKVMLLSTSCLTEVETAPTANVRHLGRVSPHDGAVAGLAGHTPGLPCSRRLDGGAGCQARRTGRHAGRSHYCSTHDRQIGDRKQQQELSARARHYHTGFQQGLGFHESDLWGGWACFCPAKGRGLRPGWQSVHR